MKILKLPHPALRTKCKKVERVDSRIRHLAREMRLTLASTAGGIGLAAPQVGITERIIVVRIIDQNALKQHTNWLMRRARSPWLCMVNPSIMASSSEESTEYESCLSIPGASVAVTRPDSVDVEYLDTRGRYRWITAYGIMARCMQHEIDHTRGILITDKAR